MSKRVGDIYILLVCYFGIVVSMCVMIDPERLVLWRWILGTAMVALFYPGCDAELASTYSKVLGAHSGKVIIFLILFYRTYTTWRCILFFGFALFWC